MINSFIMSLHDLVAMTWPGWISILYFDFSSGQMMLLQIIDVQQPSQGSQSAVGRGSGLRQSPAQELITLHTLYGAPESEAQYGGQELYSYQRPSRDLQFNYVNTAKKEGEKFIDMKEEPSAQEILETLVRLVSPEDLDDLYIR